jgi:uncharacterized damage-inducible protein DinB
MLDEFREEAALTRRILERVPEDKLTWKPHPKSMALGQLAIHIATVPGAVAKITQPDAFDVSEASFQPPHPRNMAEVYAALDESTREVEAFLGAMTAERAQGDWCAMAGDKELFHKPRIRVLRSIMLNHWYHHRGQLSVYLRLLEVPVPSIYGPSADDNPFA